MHTALSIAGSDSSGGAGIQADLKTFLANDVFGMTAITTITAQNTTGVSEIDVLSPQLLAAQIEAVFTDIPPEAVKIGMVGNGELITTIVDSLKKYPEVPIVLDPVMVATSGASLFTESQIDVYYDQLFPMATVTTPNLHEAEVIYGEEIHDEETMELAAKTLAQKFHAAFIIKGGHFTGDEAVDILATETETYRFAKPRVDNPNTHGTGCTFSSAIAANLAKGYSLPESVQNAKDYLTAALSTQLDLGEGSGPLDHGYRLREVNDEA